MITAANYKSKIFLDFCCEWSKVHQKYFDMTVEDYIAAKREIEKRASAHGYTINDLASACTYAGD